MLSYIEDNHGPSDAMHNPSQPLKVRKTLFQNSWRFTHFYQFSQSELVDIEKNIRVISFTMKMEILLESTSNKLMVEHAEYDESNTYVLERFNTTAGNPVKEILLKLNLPDHRIRKDGGEGT
ncbi:hypothetical protein Tco_0706061 [Tanacetum coccineum]|uniref:Uncharacterized protein n=1 Tax=Tanacetum coccineum TaxID=301880 RepID=A0ABQ4Y773_9ASTR